MFAQNCHSHISQMLLPEGDLIHGMVPCCLEDKTGLSHALSGCLS